MSGVRELLSFVIPGEPVAKGRARARARKSASGRDYSQIYTPPESAAFEDRVSMFARDAGAEVLDGPVSLTARFWFEWPRSKWRKTRAREEAWKDTGKDVDNLVKAIMDGLNGVAYYDDRQVAVLIVQKRYAAQGSAARTEIEVEPLEN